ncbi:MAG: prolyl oligopeptidase family serine peptidase [Verrucomicrobiaceae bacterium]|nr:prolyl oligopeptidase family serine peptidase [Verrucomicrobiaceae bacterium]
MIARTACLAVLLSAFTAAHSADFRSIPTEPTEGDRMLDAYFERETRRLTAKNAAFIENTTDWPAAQANLRRQLFEMLGLQPLPERSDLKAEITGSLERDGVIVEALTFQSQPGLYVTANFYRPAKQDGPLPTILYVCGHGRVQIDGVSYGNKATYQHHGTWFAKNGYTCLTIDTLQLGEIEGIHHGTHNLGRWWWNSRGYTPAGVEAWNSIRALDYLETRPEVDKEKFGVTGRSGGGAYTLWIAALDERIKVAAPVAGITSMKNHVVDGCVEGHCDCMFMVNTYRWDFPLVTALIAPRPLMILNTDKDRIFPVDGVVDVYQKTRKIYEAMDSLKNIGLAFYEGPHKDTQPLRVPAFHWFERQFKGIDIGDEIADTRAPKIFEPTELKVFGTLPEDERNSKIDEEFTERVPDTFPLPETAEDWQAEKNLILNRLKTRSFRGWPAAGEDLRVTLDFREEKDGMILSRWSFDSQTGVRLPLYLIQPAAATLADLDLIVLNALGEEDWTGFLEIFGAGFSAAFPGVTLPEHDAGAYESEKKLHASQKWGMLYLPVRGTGPTAWTTDEKERIHIRRRFALLGQTLDGMRIWDIRRGIQALRTLDGAGEPELWLQASGVMAGNALHASLFEKDIKRLDLHDLPTSHREGPVLLNVLRFTDLPQIAAIAGEKSQLRLYDEDAAPWSYLSGFAKKMDWPEKQLQIRTPAKEQ